MTKALVYIISLALIVQILFSQNLPLIHAIAVEYDFETPADYTISDSSAAYVHGGAAKLLGNLNARGHIENGPAAMDWATNTIVDGNYAYVTGYGSHAVTAIDISDPTNVSAAGYIGADGTRRLYGAYDLKKVGNFIYVASLIDDDLEIIDATDPTNLTHGGRFVDTGATFMNGIRGIDVVGNFAYLAAYSDDALQIIDISNPASPSARGSIQDNARLNGATSVKVVGNYAYVTSYIDDSLQIIDISDPDNPTFAAEVTDTGTTELNGAWGLDVVGNYAYVAAYNDDGLEIIDISTPTSPTHVGEIQNSDPGIFLNGAREIEVVGNYAYISAYADDSLQIIDISNPAVPIGIGVLDTNSFGRLDAAFGIAVDGPNVYMNSYTNGTFQSIDASTISAPVFQDELESGPVRLGNAVGVKVDGDYAYVASYGSNGIEILDISDSSNPTHVSSYTDNSVNNELFGSWDLEKDGDYLYVSGYSDNGIEVIDVSNPASPNGVARILDSGTTVELQNPRGLHIVGNLLYVAGYNGDALQIIDISNPLNPVARGNYKSTTNLDRVNDVQVSGNYAFLTAYQRDKITVIDVSDPDNPTYETELADAAGLELNGVWDLQIDGDYAYIASYVDDAIVIIDISDPTNPTYAGDQDDNGVININGPRGIVYDEGYAYIPTYFDNSVATFDVSDPTDPLFIDDIVNFSLYDTSTKIDKKDNDLFFTQYVGSSFSVVRESYPNTSPHIIPSTPIASSTIYSISETHGIFNEGSISFQLSNDNGATWYYHNGANWVATVGGTANSNTSSVVNLHAEAFNALPGNTGQLLWKAFLNSDGSQKVELEHVLIETDPPSPGAVASNLALWLKADDGTSTLIDGNPLTTWNDQSLNGLNATAVVTPDYRNNDADSINFNPVIDFNGTNDYMSNLANGVSSKSYYLVFVPDADVEGTSSQGVPFGFNCNSGVLSSGTCGLDFGGLALGSFTVAIPDEVMTHALGSSANWRSADTDTVALFPSGKPMLVGVNENASANGTDIYEVGKQVNDFTTNTYQSLSTADYSIGRSPDNTYPFPFNGKIAEIINYSERTSDTDRQKIESYLAIKYGMTLQEGTQDYTASDGTTIFWDASSAGSYINNIFGIGRDDSQELGQVKSKSENVESIITLEANGEGSNINPSFNSIANKEFLMISDDGASNSWTAIDSPASFNILSRKWKIQETGDTGTVSMSFDVADSDFDIPMLNAGTNYYIVYDTDGDNSLTDETPSVLTNSSGDIWDISSINPSDGRIFTLATEASSNNIPTDITPSASSVDENVAVGSVIASLTTTDADPGDTHTYSLVSGSGDDDNSKFTIVSNMLNILESPDYEIQSSYTIRVETDDGNGGTYQEVIIITVNDLSEVISTIIDFETPGKYTVPSGQWNRTTTNPYEGTFSLESDNLGLPNTQSCFEVEHTHSSTGSIDFFYNVSSQAGGDFLRFYIDDIEQDAWSGNVAWTQYTQTDIAAGTYEYKWCYIKNANTNTGLDAAFIDYITFPSGITDTIAPTILSGNFASGALLPGGNHSIEITYEDLESGIDTGTADIQLQKWDGVSAFGPDISGTSIGAGTVGTGSASYPTLGLVFGKYRYTFSIDDIAGNTATVERDFYIDEPELIVGSGSIDIGDVNHLGVNFSDTVTVQVLTVGAAFDLTFTNTTLLNYDTASIPTWDSSEGFGYQQVPYGGSLSAINTDQVIASQAELINTNGNRNSYTYDIQLGALVDILQAGGDYMGDLKFDINLNY